MHPRLTKELNRQKLETHEEQKMLDNINQKNQLDKKLEQFAENIRVLEQELMIFDSLFAAFQRGIQHTNYKPDENVIFILNKTKSIIQQLNKQKKVLT